MSADGWPWPMMLGITAQVKEVGIAGSQTERRRVRSSGQAACHGAFGGEADLGWEKGALL